jgi:CheY-like chemotaxis protein
LAYRWHADVPDWIRSDMTRVRQILLNLLSNAVKFTSEGEILVVVRSHRLAGERYEIQFSVRDSGIGIAPENLNHLFDAFTQADASTTRKYGGTGLGLTISRKLAELMGGRMWAESVEGRGSTFMFTIVAEASEIPEDATGNRLPSQSFLQKKRLGVVSANAAIRSICSQTLKEWGAGVDDFASVQELLLRLSHGYEFDALLVNALDPGRDLSDLTTGLQSLGIERPIVVLCRRSDRSVVSSCGLPSIGKPLSLRDLAGELAEQLGAVATSPGGVAEAEPTTPSAAKGRPLGPGSSRLLLAEDNVVNQKVACHMLKRLGWTVDIAENGRLAIEALRSQDYDVVLMDVQMPEMDGLTATRLIRAGEAGGKQPPIIAMTANAMDGDRDRCLQAGMDDYIAKPISMEKLKVLLTGLGVTA